MQNILTTVCLFEQQNGVLSHTQTGQTKGEGIVVNIREAWQQINDLLGKKVYTTIYADMGHLEERYILTPIEAVLYLGPFPEYTGLEHPFKNRWNEDCLRKTVAINPDPTREEAYEAFLEKPSQKYKFESPRYWLARPVKNFFLETPALEAWIEHALFMDGCADPMHIMGEKDGVPIIYYAYGTHSHLLSYGPKGDVGLLLSRMKEAGMTMPK